MFIDSDNLQELDTLFDIVRAKLDTLVVYLTKETLSRPWCAGEICTAGNSSKVRTLVIRTPSFVVPTQEELSHLETYLDLSACNLTEYNMPLRLVQESFEKLLKQDYLELDTKQSGAACFDKLVCDILKTSPSTINNETRKGADEHSSVVISSLPHNDEATAAACILNLKITRDVLALNETGTRLLVDMGEVIDVVAEAIAKCQAGIVMLSFGTMESSPQLVAIAQLMSTVAQCEAQAPGVIPVTLPGFGFPDAAYFEVGFPKFWPYANYSEASLFIQTFFKRIAVGFHTGASDQALDTQVLDILARIPRIFDEKKAGTRKSTIHLVHIDYNCEQAVV